MQQELTYSQQAEHEINSVLSFEPKIPDEDKASWYAALFLMDYTVALYSPNTTEEHFLAAYSNRALSIMHCQPKERADRREALDEEAYRIRQDWSIKHRDSLRLTPDRTNGSRLDAVSRRVPKLRLAAGGTPPRPGGR